MKSQKLLNAFLELLDDDVVANKIRSISGTAYNSDNIGLPGESEKLHALDKQFKDQYARIKDLEREISERTAECVTLRNCVKEKDIKLDLLSSEFDEQKQQIYLLQQRNETLDLVIKQAKENETLQNTVIKQLQSKKAELLTEFSAFNQYLSISDKTRNALMSIFKQDTLTHFIACGVQRDNIESLWDFTAKRVLDGNTNDIAMLRKTIDYFINLYNATSKTLLIEKQVVNVGDIFDPIHHTRTSDSNPSGEINEILLQGYSNAITKASIKKTIVRVF